MMYIVVLQKKAEADIAELKKSGNKSIIKKEPTYLYN